MAKKQNPDAIRAEHDRFTADLHAWAVFKGSEHVANITVRYGGRSSPHGLTVRAYVHVLGLPMVRGIARGGGYDMKSAAIVGTWRMWPKNTYQDDAHLSLSTRQTVKDFAGLKDGSHDIPHQLREMGYTVAQVL